ncbi:MAG: UDP-N-acetylglucosamine 2-epimerase (non-hydrolyzing) [Chitinophagaceae bacterium]|nr:UDP-N-acetylglucosamine 2-epimerase (non-hydrolyzing) [Chitinophagaceae bacterium]MCW5926333.1 UDP-N-acetylglucosamine 2-epimerase (non-hydrolyzing) [Chitinophagaceae bacterium]
MINCTFVFGTRPEAIKLAPLIIKLREAKVVNVEVCVTGQHREMLTQVLDVFEITPDVDLKLMSHNQSLPDFLGKSISALHNYLKDSNADYVIVQGDTSTVLSASIAAFYNKRKVLHVEAGLRTTNIYSPFPEEMNRRLTSQLTYHHFVPTGISKQNLLKEGYAEETIMITGNTAIDSLLFVKNKLNEGVLHPASDVYDIVRESQAQYNGYILITGHRRENFGEGFLNICEAIELSARKHPDYLYIYPVHLNPNVHSIVSEKLGGISNIRLMKPQSYVDFIYLMQHAHVILTDSGGVQEEAPSLQKPILVMRESTERPEGITAGCSKLVGVNVQQIVSEIGRLLSDADYYGSFAVAKNPYGDGNASGRILNFIEQLT